jgi:hypothetical protein
LAVINSLFELATGGSNVAVHLAQDLDSNLLLGLGESPSGVDAAVSWFTEQLKSGRQSFLFLVGGPGGGKSHTTTRLVQELTEIEPKTERLAHRKHRYSTVGGSHKVTVINDATIRGNEHDDFPLVRDLAIALSSGDSLICCVNRGVLLEESLCSDVAFSSLIQLVTDLQKDYLEVPDKSKGSVVTSQVLVHLSLNHESSTIPVVRVAFDLCSLFEAKPAPTITVSEEQQPIIKSARYKVARFASRTSNVEISSSIANKLLSKVVVAVADQYQSLALSADPIAANLETLGKESMIEAICSVGRASEITAGRRFTYRELWGFIARVIVGDLPDFFAASDLAVAISGLQPLGEQSALDFERMAELGDLRFSQAMFGVKFANRAGLHLHESYNPVTKLLAAVDPVRDMQPGNVLPNSLATGWATPLHDAFSGAISATSPLAALLALSKNNIFKDAVTNFDSKLDDCFVSVMGWPELDKRKREKYIAWYSGYLARLYAVVNGVPAFVDVVSTWTLLYDMSPLLPSGIKEQFLTLITPAINPTERSSSLIPLYDSRTTPIQGEISEPKLALRVNDVEIRTQADGDSLYLLLEESGKQTARVILDFSVLREALACSGGYTGVTELTAGTAPRLERIRASNLIPESQSNIGKFFIASRGAEDAFQIVGSID